MCGAIIAAVLLAAATPAAACPRVKSLHLDSYTFSVDPPTAQTHPDSDPCSTYSDDFICGDVWMNATFSGLAGHPRPVQSLADGDLTGTAHVTRVYGCQNAVGKRLRQYDRRVSEDVNLDTRFGNGFTLPPHGNTVDLYTYLSLPDSQPGNCPTGTQAMMYELRARSLTVTLSANTATWTWVPATTTYSTPARARWRGAVPTPVPAASV